MVEILITILIGIAIGVVGSWLFIRKLPQERIREINYARLQEEQLLFEDQRERNEQELYRLEEDRRLLLEQKQREASYVDELTKQIGDLLLQKNVLANDVGHLVNQREDISSSLERSRTDAKRAAEVFYEQQMSLAKEKLEKALEEVAKKFQEEEQAYQDNYRLVLREYIDIFNQMSAEQKEKYTVAQLELEELQATVASAVAAAKREEEKRQEKNFYRLVLPENDLNEIQQLRSVEPFLRDKEALNKVIWKVYYEKPYTDLIGRVVGTEIKTGIYKITNIENQMCYVGQAVNIADRWKQHIKRGIGAEPPTRNKLYPAMQSIGVENFTFEIIEECGREALDAKEDYWQEYFHAKDFGYSIK